MKRIGLSAGGDSEEHAAETKKLMESFHEHNAQQVDAMNAAQEEKKKKLEERLAKRKAAMKKKMAKAQQLAAAGQ